MIVRGFGHLTELKRPRDYGRPYGLQIDRILAQAGIGLVDELKARLSNCFEVTVTQDIYSIWKKSSLSEPKAREILVDWEVEGCVERKTRQERATLDSFDRHYGFPLKVLIQALADAMAKRSGPTPSIQSIGTRVAKALRDQGHEISARQINDTLELLKRYRADELPDTLKPPLPPNVVPFATRLSTANPNSQ